jgi:hypothetical protein
MKRQSWVWAPVVGLGAARVGFGFYKALTVSPIVQVYQAWWLEPVWAPEWVICQA